MDLRLFFYVQWHAPVNIALMDLTLFLCTMTCGGQYIFPHGPQTLFMYEDMRRSILPSWTSDSFYCTKTCAGQYCPDGPQTLFTYEDMRRSILPSCTSDSFYVRRYAPVNMGLMDLRLFLYTKTCASQYCPHVDLRLFLCAMTCAGQYCPHRPQTLFMYKEMNPPPPSTQAAVVTGCNHHRL